MGDWKAAGRTGMQNEEQKRGVSTAQEMMMMLMNFHRSAFVRWLVKLRLT
jgi:hypothetical protein